MNPSVPQIAFTYKPAEEIWMRDCCPEILTFMSRLRSVEAQNLRRYCERNSFTHLEIGILRRRGWLTDFDWDTRITTTNQSRDLLPLIYLKCAPFPKDDLATSEFLDCFEFFEITKHKWEVVIANLDASKLWRAAKYQGPKSGNHRLATMRWFGDQEMLRSANFYCPQLVASINCFRDSCGNALQQLATFWGFSEVEIDPFTYEAEYLVGHDRRWGGVLLNVRRPGFSCTFDHGLDPTFGHELEIEFELPWRVNVIPLEVRRDARMRSLKARREAIIAKRRG